VVLVVGRVEVLAVPAGLEEGLRADSLALAGRESVGVRNGLGVETHVLDGTVLEAGGVEGAGFLLLDI
jgi:hypothetical protein